MATYGQMVLTQQGIALYQKAQTGVQLNFTRMQIGSGQLAQGQDPTTLTALITPVDFFSINSVSSSGNTAYVKGIFENTNINASTYSCELGLFATDPTAGEILYAYANAGALGDTIPPISDGPISKQFQINVAIGNATSITATIPSNTYIPTTELGAANGVAQLGADEKLLPAQLPTNAATTGANTFNGNQTAPQFVSNAAQGTPPVEVVSTTLVQNFNADLLDGLHADGVVGQRIQVSNPASDQYYLIGTLPASASTTYDKLMIKLQGGPSWDASTLINDWVMMGNRDTSNVAASKFTYQYEQAGVDPNNSRANLRIVAYKQSDGSVQVYLRALAGTSSIGIVAAYGASLNGQSTTAIQIGAPSTTVPAGTLVFDSGNSATYPPNANFAAGAATFNGLATLNGGATLPNGKTLTLNGPVNGSTVGAANGLATLGSDGNLVQSAKSLIEGTTNAGRLSIPNYDQYLSNPGANYIYTTLQLKRPNGTLYMQSVLSNPDANGNYQTDTWTFYAADGVTVTATHIWSITYDANNKITQKVMQS